MTLRKDLLSNKVVTGGVTFGFTDTHKQTEKESDTGNQLASVAGHEVKLEDELKVNPALKNELKHTPLGDYFTAYQSTSMEAFDDACLSIEADMVLLEQIGLKFKQDSQNFGRMLSPDQLRSDNQFYGEVKVYKDNFKHDAELMEKLSGNNISKSFEAHYSTEGFIESFSKILQRIFQKLKELFTSIFGPTSKVEKAYQDLDERNDKAEEQFRNIDDRIQKFLEDEETSVEMKYFLTVNSLYYLLGDDIKDAKKVLVDPDKLNKYVDDLVVRIEAFVRQFQLFEYVIKELAVLIYHTEKYKDVKNVNEENISKTGHTLNNVFTAIQKYVETTEGVVRVDGSTYKIPEIRRGGYNLFYIKDREGHQYFESRNDVGSNNDVRGTLGDVYESLKHDLLKEFVINAKKNKVKLEKGMKSIKRSLDHFNDFRDLTEVYRKDIVKILNTSIKISSHLDDIHTAKFKIPGYNWNKVNADMKVSFADTYFLIGSVMTFCVTTMMRQFSDVTDSQRALTTLLNLYTLAK